MILIDSGPFVALFNSADKAHQQCVTALKKIQEPLMTTVPILTEVFHILDPSSHQAEYLRNFLSNKGAKLWFMDDDAVSRAFVLMRKYVDHPMDFADASLVVAAERLKIFNIFTLDRNDFETYRFQIGHNNHHMKIITC